MWTRKCSGLSHRGSSSLVLPRPYSGITFSLLMAALQTGHSCRDGLVSSHWCKQGQQNKWPHMLTTASLAVSKQMLHSNMESSFFWPSPFFESLSIDSADGARSGPVSVSCESCELSAADGSRVCGDSGVSSTNDGAASDKVDMLVVLISVTVRSKSSANWET